MNMAKHTCPHCNHEFSTVSTRRIAAPAAVDTATLTDAQLYAYYKSQAPVEDARFFLRSQRSSLSAVHAVRLSTLIATSPKRAAALAELRTIQREHFKAKIAAEYSARQQPIAA
jgi:predicted negative regulator of RcsB-dependent stress response